MTQPILNSEMLSVQTNQTNQAAWTAVWCDGVANISHSHEHITTRSIVGYSYCRPSTRVGSFVRQPGLAATFVRSKLNVFKRPLNLLCIIPRGKNLQVEIITIISEHKCPKLITITIYQKHLTFIDYSYF